MICIILHADDKLKLLKYQKSLIALNHPAVTLIRKNPLWISLPADTNNLSEISKEIQKITIDEPQLKGDDIKSEVNIVFNNKELKSELTFLSVYKAHSNNNGKIEIKNPPDLSFPMDLKIFRIAETEKLSDNSYASTASVWKKIK